ncbi:MAG: transposase [Bacteroidota bacterium]
MPLRYKRYKQYRLPSFNYASSASYFVTICTKNRQHYFGSISNGGTDLSNIGKIVRECLCGLSDKLSYVTVDEFVIMPNHLHMIVLINNPEENRSLKTKEFQPAKRSLSLVIRNFKSAVTLLAHRNIGMMDIWQPRFYDHIIRNEHELNRIRMHIRNNPAQWESDRNHPKNIFM